MKRFRAAMVCLIVFIAAQGVNGDVGCFVCSNAYDPTSFGTEPKCVYPQSGDWGSERCSVVQFGPIGTPRVTKVCQVSGWSCLYYQVTP